MEQSVRYFLIEPSLKRRGFVLVAYVLEGRSKKKYVKLDEPTQAQVKKINSQFKTGILTQAEAKTLLNDLIQKQYKKAGVKDMVLKNSKLSEINQKIFNQFWSKVYSVRFIADEKSPRYDILKAIRLIEPLALSTATEQEFQVALKKSCKTTNEHRRAVDRLNQLLKFLGRDFTLRKPPEGLVKVKYVTKEELEKILSMVDNPIERDFIVTLFGSGLRLSEALALSPENLTGRVLNIHEQLVLSGERKLPKRNKTGTVAVFQFTLDAVRRWCEVPNKADYRFRIFNVLSEVCPKAFPNQRAKWVSPHDLRHSHAIHMLGEGATLTQVSLNLRNRMDVCQKYYTGFAHSEGTLDSLLKLI
jgi:integrase